MNLNFRLDDDFINLAGTHSGCGFFQGHEIAVDLSKNLSKKSIQAYRKGMLIPPIFFVCLQAIGFLKSEFVIPKRPATIQEAQLALQKEDFT